MAIDQALFGFSNLPLNLLLARWRVHDYEPRSWIRRAHQIGDRLRYWQPPWRSQDARS